jgi:hypothetical protein
LKTKNYRPNRQRQSRGGNGIDLDRLVRGMYWCHPALCI